MSKRPTLQDLAALTGTSKSTVSRVLTGRGYVAPAVREAVLRAAREQGYTPGRSRKKNHIRDMVMVICSQLDSEVQAILCNAVLSRLQQHGLKAAIVSVPFAGPDLYAYLDYARERSFGGVISLGMLDTADLRKGLSKLSCPVVLLNQQIEGCRASMVAMDDYCAGYTATRFLLDQGHRRIAFLNGYMDAAAVADRERGFCDAMADAGILADAFDIFYKGFDEKSGSAFADELFAAGLPYTAVIAANDLLGIGFLLRLRQLGVSVPQRISIVCFDDTLATRVCDPPLTVIRYDFEAMGHALAQCLIDSMAHPFTRAQVTAFTPQLISRASVGAPPADVP